MTEGFWTKCWEVARDGEQEADADAARIESRDDNGYGSMLAGYDFGRNEGVGKCQLHEAAKMLRREILNLDNMLGEQ